MGSLVTCLQGCNCCIIVGACKKNTNRTCMWVPLTSLFLLVYIYLCPLINASMEELQFSSWFLIRTAIEGCDIKVFDVFTLYDWDWSCSSYIWQRFSIISNFDIFTLYDWVTFDFDSQHYQRSQCYCDCSLKPWLIQLAQLGIHVPLTNAWSLCIKRVMLKGCNEVVLWLLIC